MMQKYIYNGENITLDIVMKIEKVVRILCERTGRSFESILSDFYKSSTYRALQNTRSTMWAESSEFIVDEVFREWNKEEDNID